jgi:hypothetical protein
MLHEAAQHRSPGSGRPFIGSGGRAARNSASVQQRARRHGIAGNYGNPGIVESVTYRLQGPDRVRIPPSPPLNFARSATVPESSVTNGTLTRLRSPHLLRNAVRDEDVVPPGAAGTLLRLTADIDSSPRAVPNAAQTGVTSSTRSAVRPEPRHPARRSGTCRVWTRGAPVPIACAPTGRRSRA